MNNTLRLNDLPTVSYLVGEVEKHLPPLDGRIVLILPTEISTQSGTRKGYRKRYSHTPAELTVLVENLQYEYAFLRDRMQSLIALPPQVEQFMAHVQAQMDRYQAEQTATLQKVSNVLDDLLAGKAKPSGDTMNLIKDTLNRLGDRVSKIEERLAAPPVPQPPQNR
ncbi:MAG: hypothetical protein FWH34_03110 [Desulfovibrionaceae bacterium]|nr:hypothetical protein [Desulfovibrionaceae bacterium]